MNYNTNLGICIPTYKRPDQLLSCVTSVIAAAEPYGVPIFISDDAADATNAEVIEQLRQRYPHIVYELNGVNLGIDRNIVKAIDMCPCRYAWPLGEDDRLLPNAVAMVLSVLDSNQDIPFVFANYYYVNNEVTHIIAEKRIPIPEDVCMDARQFFENYAWTIGFIGACVIRKSEWDKIEKEKYLDTYFTHVGTILEYLPGTQVYLISEPVVLNRAENPESFTWSDFSFEVFFGWDKMMALLKNIYDEDSYRKAVASSKVIFLNSVKSLCPLRVNGKYNIAKYNKYISRGDYSPLFKAIAYMIASLPPGICKALNYLYRPLSNIIVKRTVTDQKGEYPQIIAK